MLSLNINKAITKECISTCKQIDIVSGPIYMKLRAIQHTTEDVTKEFVKLNKIQYVVDKTGLYNLKHYPIVFVHCALVTLS